MADSGLIKAVTSDVKAIAIDGSERVLRVGDTVSLNETIITGSAGTVSIWLSDGTKLGLEENTNTILDESFFYHDVEIIKDPVVSSAEDEVAAIQQALMDDQSFDPSKLEAPAAGETSLVDEGDFVDGEGHNAVSIDYLNPVITPESGFNTRGVNNGDSLLLDLTLGELILEPRAASIEAIASRVTDGNEVNTIYQNNQAVGNVLDNTINLDGASLVTSFSFGGQTAGAGSLITLAGVGELTISGTGEYSFTPETTFNGFVTNISYVVVDTTDPTDTVDSTLNIAVLPEPVVQVTDHNGIEVGDNAIVEGSTTAITGNFVLEASEGVASIRIAGVDISVADLLVSTTTPIDFTTGKGVLSIDGYNESTGTVEYSYLPASSAQDHSAGDESIIDQFEITVTDVNGQASNTAILDILIKDTEPQAFDNIEQLSQNQEWLVDGVINNVRNANDNAADDLIGVDGAKLKAVTYDGTTLDFTLNATDLISNGNGDFFQFTTDNGTLYIRDDGDYWYQNTTVGGNAEVTDTFSYQLIDSDGDLSSANLTITQVLGDINTGDLGV